MPTPLPDYDRPPLDEVVIGLQFEPLPKFRSAHLGLYWASIRERYPASEEHPPLPHLVEQSQLAPDQQQLKLITGVLPQRTWFLDKTGNCVIQIQRDRFLRNWRQTTGTDVYPRYGPLIEQFRKEYTGFRTFVEKEALGTPKINQCELTYTNNIDVASSESLGDLSKILAFMKPRNPEDFLPLPVAASLESRYALPENRGALYVRINPAFRGRDMKLILTLNLTARGAPLTGSDDHVFQWFDVGHEWIARGFDQLTDPAMHRHWGKKR